MRPRYLVIVLVSLALAVPASPAYAGGIVSVCDEAHLLAALAGGGKVMFSCSGTIILTAQIAITADTTIDGSGQDVTIRGNLGGRVFKVNPGVTLNLNELTVANGNAQGGDGGGIFNEGTLNVSNSTFSDNYADSGAGGGIYNEGGVLTVSNSTFSGNSVTYRGIGGGGIYNNHAGTLAVSNSTFAGNNGGPGAGIYNGGTLIVSNSTFSGNSAIRFSAGGGIYNDGSLTVTNSTFSGNRAVYFGIGGGIFNGDGTLTVSNSTFSGNSADNHGGGIDNYHGTVTVSNSTFSDNSAGFAGGIRNNDGTVTLENTIVTNNPIGSNCAGTIVDGGGNLSYPDTTCPGINADPLLGPAQNNGGPTETMALGSGSAAIDAGDDAICAADPVNGLDQRGVIRPQGAHCDIGAVEQEAYPSLPPRMWLPAVHAQ